MGREFELKYSARPWQLAQIDAVLQGKREDYAMRTTYYDTPDGQLSARKWMLRLRRENEEAVCTLKTPLPDGSRGEWEARCESVEEAVSFMVKDGCPEELAALVSEGLVPVCGAEFTRRAVTISYRDAVLEIAMDQGVLKAGAKQCPLCETEIELKSGSEEAALEFARDFASEFALTQEARSKAQRAFALMQEG